MSWMHICVHAGSDGPWSLAQAAGHGCACTLEHLDRVGEWSELVRNVLWISGRVCLRASSSLSHPTCSLLFLPASVRAFVIHHVTERYVTAAAGDDGWTGHHPAQRGGEGCGT